MANALRVGLEIGPKGKMEDNDLTAGVRLGAMYDKDSSFRTWSSSRRERRNGASRLARAHLYDTRSISSGLLPILLAEVEASAEALDAARGIKDALLASEERMALRADIHAEVLLRAADGEGIAAGAGYLRLLVYRVDSSFHGVSHGVAPLSLSCVPVQLRTSRAPRKPFHCITSRSAAQARLHVVTGSLNVLRKPAAEGRA
jgi:hypothetical protein